LLTNCNRDFNGIASPLQTLAVRLNWAGAVAGGLAGVGYAFLSSSHMTVQHDRDLFLVGAALTALGACLGWLAGVLIRRPLLRNPRRPVL
jgi:hypothetical protein